MGKLKHYQLQAAKGAVVIGALLNALFFAATVVAQDVKYVGRTAESFQGGDGLFDRHRACALQFKDGVWCTSEMIASGIHKGTLAPTGAEWVNITPTGALDLPFTDPTLNLQALVDYSGFILSIGRISCTLWTNSDPAPDSGLTFGPRTTIPPISPSIGMSIAACAAEIPAACCSKKPIKRGRAGTERCGGRVGVSR